jgi:hypothetical protein
MYGLLRSITSQTLLLDRENRENSEDEDPTPIPGNVVAFKVNDLEILKIWLPARSGVRLVRVRILSLYLAVSWLLR